MQKKMWTALGAGCVTGAFGLFFRWLQLVNCFETATGLYTSGAASYVFVIWSAAVAVGLFVYAGKCFPKKRPARDAAEVFACGPVGKGIGNACAACMCLGGLLILFSANAASSPLAERILGVLAFAAGFCFAMQLHDIRSGSRTAVTMICALLPVLLFCFWLVLCYKEHARNPVIWQFGVQIVAMCVLAVSFYATSGYLVGKAVPSRVLWLLLLSVYACFTVFPDSMPFGRKLVFFSACACQLYMISMLLGDRPQPAAEPPAQP